MSQRKAAVTITTSTYRGKAYVYARCEECINEDGTSFEYHKFEDAQEARAWRDLHRESIHPVGIPRTLNLSTKVDRKIVRANPQGAPHTNVINRDSQESHKRGS